jgi:hypothetical protein
MSKIFSPEDIQILNAEELRRAFGNKDYQESSLHFGKEFNKETNKWEPLNKIDPNARIIKYGEYTVNLDSIGAIEVLLYRIYSNVYNVKYKFSILLIVTILLTIGLFIYFFIEFSKQKKELNLVKKELDKKTNIV